MKITVGAIFRARQNSAATSFDVSPNLEGSTIPSCRRTHREGDVTHIYPQISDKLWTAPQMPDVRNCIKSNEQIAPAQKCSKSNREARSTQGAILKYGVAQVGARKQ